MLSATSAGVVASAGGAGGLVPGGKSMRHIKKSMGPPTTGKYEGEE